MKSVAEVDRVLKTKGIIIMDDFETSIPYKRINQHDKRIYTYKQCYSNLFVANPQYSVIFKEVYKHGQLATENNIVEFCLDVQDRMSTTILFKDTIENAYIEG